jgi:deoxyribodipyrimidine photo-lyase
MPDDRPILAWLRRDLRLGDHPMLTAAADSGRPVIPVFLCDEVVEAQGTAPVWRLGKSVADLAGRLGEIGSRLILRRGRAAEALRDLAEETGAAGIWWTRAYDPDGRARDDAAEKLEIETRVFGGHLMFEPWEVETGAGEAYKVYSPYWRAVKDRDVAAPMPAVNSLRPPETWPQSDVLADWKLGAGMRRGAAIVAPHLVVGETSAASRLAAFTGNRIADYARLRDLPAEEGTSGLSENLTYGEISIRACWHAGRRAREEGKAGAETWLKELVWREFAYHLLWHTPRLMTGNWRPEWDAFPWRGDNAEAQAWCRGRTGVPFVDAAMREMYVTGRMHNRARMIVASYLTKHLMTHWRIGHDWFVDCLVDWDPANNALGWQWSAGSGPDATPFFRVFNPETQRERFDPEGAYLERWIAEGRARPARTALDYFEAIQEGWGLDPGDPYPDPIVGLKEGRERALGAYQDRNF